MTKSLVFCGVLGRFAIGCAVALLPWRVLAADLSPVPPQASPPPEAAPYAPWWASQFYDPHRFELRAGAFLHSVGGYEHGTYDLNGEVVGPRLPILQDQVWGMFVPRPHAGVLANLEGRTSALYAGALWSFPLPYRTFFEIFVDGAVHNGFEQNPPPGRAALGCPALFHVGGSLGYAITEHWTAMFTFDHLSNGHYIFGINCSGNIGSTPNPGQNDWGVRLGYAF